MVPGTKLGTADRRTDTPRFCFPHHRGSEGPIYGDPHVVWAVAADGQGPGVSGLGEEASVRPHGGSREELLSPGPCQVGGG